MTTPSTRTLERVERKLATVLFVDLVESTRLLATTDPEVVRRRVNRFFDQVSHYVESYGGVVEKFAGDAVLAAFGVPQAHEDDAERAVRAALAIRDAVGELDLEVRIGIESGEVVTEESDSTFATGEPVNVAARLQQAAAPGEILLGPGVHSLSQLLIECEEVEPVDVRGLGRSVSAWRLAGVADEVGRVLQVSAPFVGREADLELLHNTYERALRDKRAQLVTIYGYPGVGKSRLAREFVAGLEGTTILAGRSLPYGEGITYWPLAEMVKAAAGIADDDPTAEALEKLRECCGDDAVADLLGLASGVLDAVTGDRSAAGDRLGRTRVGDRARRGAAARARVRGHPLGRGAVARPDRAPGGARAGRAGADPHARQAGALRHPSGLGRWPSPRGRDRARAAAARGQRELRRRAARGAARRTEQRQRCWRRRRATRSSSRRPCGCSPSRATAPTVGSRTRCRRSSPPASTALPRARARCCGGRP